MCEDFEYYFKITFKKLNVYLAVFNQLYIKIMLQISQLKNVCFAFTFLMQISIL